MFGYIYKTTDLSNGKIYVGKHHSSTFVGLEYIGSGYRITQIKHKCLREGIERSTRFSVEMIAQADTLEELNEKEIYWIDKLDSRNPDVGYNMRKGGDCGPGGPMMLGKKHSEETKQKMSEDRKGSKNSNFGNHWKASEELKELHSKLSSGELNGMYGKKHSKESLDKMRSIKVGKYIGWRKVNNGIVEKMVSPDELQQYLDNGFSLGMLKRNIK